MSTIALTEREVKAKARKNLTFLLLFAIVMFFVALSSAYIVSKGSTEYWVNFRIPTAFYISAVVIAVSSVCVQMALMRVRKGDARASALWLLATLVLGCAFTFSQFRGWSELASRGLNFSTKVQYALGEYGKDFTVLRKGIALKQAGGHYYMPDDAAFERPLDADIADYKNTATAYFHVFTIGHWLHLIGGMLALLVLTLKAFMGRYTAADHVGVWQGAVYWHFLGILWIYLLVFMAIVH